MIRKEFGEIKQLQVLESQKKDTTDKSSFLIPEGCACGADIYISLEEKLSRLLHWVSPVDVETNHSAACKLRQSGTGRWFTEGHVFRGWLTKENSFLWLHGTRMCFILERITKTESDVNWIICIINSGHWKNNSFVSYFNFRFYEHEALLNATNLGRSSSIESCQKRTPEELTPLLPISTLILRNLLSKPHLASLDRLSLNSSDRKSRLLIFWNRYTMIMTQARGIYNQIHRD